MAGPIADRRWLVKKAARKFVAEASWASGSLGLRRLGRGPRVRALTYHRFGELDRDPFCIRPTAFEAQMRWLAESGLAVSLADLEAFVAGRRSLRDGSVLVTIDDGCESTFTHALPILREYAVPAVAYVTASLVDNLDAAAGEPERYLTWDELASVAEGGVTVGSHAWTHNSLGRMPLERAREQARRSRALLEERLGVPIRSFAYPFGTRADYSAATGRVLGEEGYTTVFTSQHGSLGAGSDPTALSRVKVEGGESLRMFRLTCRGAMDPWRAVDWALWRAQLSRKEPVLQEAGT
ncbi:MAG: polysaccharide deacetylase family protein [Proteobacteria bacterium]|nr:polysaccharide deacetylase family protein [Pseudomonadota bacterium]